MRKEGETTEVGKIISEKLALDNKFFPVIERVIETPDGEIRPPQLVWDRSGKIFAVALALTEDNLFVLVREPKYGQMKNFLMVPAGGVKTGEEPISAASREFTEETGYQADTWKSLRNGPVVDFPDKTDGGEHYFFLGMNARKISEAEKFRKVVLVSRVKAEQLLAGTHPNSRLEIAMSLVGLSLALRSLP